MRLNMKCIGCIFFPTSVVAKKKFVSYYTNLCDRFNPLANLLMAK